MLLGGWEVELELMGEEEGGIMVRIRVQWRAQAIITATKGTERDRERGREGERGKRKGGERKKGREGEKKRERK